MNPIIYSEADPGREGSGVQTPLLIRPVDFFYHLSLTKILAKTGSYVITQYQVYNVHLSCSISWLI